MHAVVGRSTVHDVEQGRTYLTEKVIPRLKDAPGFVSGHWVRLEDGSGASIVVFESEEGARAAAEQVRENPPPEGSVTINSLQVGEVVAHA